MVNGQNVNTLAETTILTVPVSLDNADRVEIIIGPGSVLYGSETLLAIVNIITKTDGKSSLDIRAGQDFQNNLKTLGYRNIAGTIAKKWNDDFNVNFLVIKKKNTQSQEN